MKYCKTRDYCHTYNCLITRGEGDECGFSFCYQATTIFVTPLLNYWKVQGMYGKKLNDNLVHSGKKNRKSYNKR